jgi:hypothetical protein
LLDGGSSPFLAALFVGALFLPNACGLEKEELDELEPRMLKSISSSSP